MNLKFLETLVCVAELQNFRQAAARLHTTQPAVSARIRALEDMLGIELIDRSGGEIRLTPAGLEALRHARAIVELSAHMRQTLSSAETLQGILRIGVIDTIIHTWLPRLIERVRTSHPRVSFELTADTSLRLAEGVRSGEIDLALLMGPLEDDGVVNHDLGRFPMAWVANPRHFHFNGPVDVLRLAEHPILSYPRHSKPYRAIERFFGASLGRQPLLNCSNSLASLVRPRHRRHRHRHDTAGCNRKGDCHRKARRRPGSAGVPEPSLHGELPRRSGRRPAGGGRRFRARRSTPVQRRKGAG